MKDQFPVKDTVQIINQKNDEITCTFSNSAGQILIEKIGRGDQTINVNYFAKGIYYIRTSIGQTLKFLKQ